jgi:hypothetical protein
MYGPPRPVKRNLREVEVVCKNVHGLLMEQAPGHDENSRVPTLQGLGHQGTIFYARLGARR